MERVEGKMATGRTRLIEGNKPFTEGNRSFFFSFWLVVLASFLQVSFAKYLNNDCALMTAQSGVLFIRAFGKRDVSRVAN